MLYFGVVRDELDGGAQITASHNPGEYNGIKMVRREAFPLSGDAGIGEIAEMVTAGSIPAPTRRDPAGSSRAISSTTTWTKVMSLHRSRRRSSRSTSCSMPGSGMARTRRAAPVRSACPARRRGCASRSTARFPNHEANPLIEENRRDIVERVIAEQGRHRHRVGRRRRPMLLHRRHAASSSPAISSRRCSPTPSCSAPGREDHLRRARELRGEGHRRRASAARRS